MSLYTMSKTLRERVYLFNLGEGGILEGAEGFLYRGRERRRRD